MKWAIPSDKLHIEKFHEGFLWLYCGTVYIGLYFATEQFNHIMNLYPGLEATIFLCTVLVAGISARATVLKVISKLHSYLLGHNLPFCSLPVIIQWFTLSVALLKVLQCFVLLRNNWVHWDRLPSWASVTSESTQLLNRQNWVLMDCIVPFHLRDWRRVWEGYETLEKAIRMCFLIASRISTVQVVWRMGSPRAIESRARVLLGNLQRFAAPWPSCLGTRMPKRTQWHSICTTPCSVRSET